VTSRSVQSWTQYPLLQQSERIEDPAARGADGQLRRGDTAAGYGADDRPDALTYPVHHKLLQLHAKERRLR